MRYRRGRNRKSRARGRRAAEKPPLFISAEVEDSGDACPDLFIGGVWPGFYLVEEKKRIREELEDGEGLTRRVKSQLKLIEEIYRSITHKNS